VDVIVLPSKKHNGDHCHSGGDCNLHSDTNLRAGANAGDFTWTASNGVAVARGSGEPEDEHKSTETVSAAAEGEI
jgi:hypothetical protein